MNSSESGNRTYPATRRIQPGSCQFDADGGFISSDKVTSHASMKQSLIMEWGADPARVQSVADSLAARKSRFHEALVADKQVFATELRGAWGVDGNVVQAIVDSFSMSLNGLQGKDVFEFYEEIIPLVVPSENAGLVGLSPVGIRSNSRGFRCSH